MRILTVRGYVVMLALIVLLAAGLFTTGTAWGPDGAVRRTIGTFEVEMVPGDPETIEAGLGLSRYALTKTFDGGIEGVGTGQMLAGGPAGVETAGTYVALERVVGTVDGRSGAFLLAHRGDINPQGYTLSITIVSGSGTGELVGISGEFRLTLSEGVHHYVLA